MPTLEPYKGDYYLWNYVPSLPAAVAFTAVFSFLTTMHTWKMVTTKSWFCLAFVIGGLCEVVGYLARAGAYNATGSLMPYLIQAIFLVIAPVFFAASLYMVYSRIVRAVHGELFSLVPPRWTTWIFVVGDWTCLNIQSGGSGLLNHASLASIGNYIIVAGLIVQVLLFVGFMICCVIFHKRFGAHIAKTGAISNAPWKSCLHMLYTTSILVLIRNIYRIVEFMMGQHGYLLETEWPLYVFDGALMILVMIAFYIWYPARLQPNSRDSMIELLPVSTVYGGLAPGTETLSLSLSLFLFASSIVTLPLVICLLCADDSEANSFISSINLTTFFYSYPIYYHRLTIAFQLMMIDLERRLSLSGVQWTVCNTTLESERISEVPLWDNGWTFHHLGLIVCAACGLIGIVCSLFLAFMHATHYSKPREQRHILRILFMVPVYCTESFLCFLFYRESVYFEVLGSCYEAFALSSFFTLLCHYAAPDLHAQKDYFRMIRPKEWLWPLSWFAKCCGGQRGCWRTPRSGLTWFNIIWTGIYQYCFIRVAMTIVAVATQAFGKYCEASLSPAFAHVWVLVIESVAVSIAMYCLIQFYVQVHGDMAQYKPFLKITAIKLVIFLSFWQTTVISFLSSSGAIKPSEKLANQDIQIGVPNLLLCIEMALFSILHLFAFPWQPYQLKNQQASDDPQYINGQIAYHGGFLGTKAMIETFNLWDLVKAVGRGFRWLFVGYKTRTNDPSYMHRDDSAFSLKAPNTADPQTSIPGPNVTAYGGPSHLDTAYHPGNQYETASDEGQELLSHAQSNPHSPYPAHRGTALDTLSDEESTTGGGYPHAHNRYYNDSYDLDVPPRAGNLSTAEPRPISPQPYRPYHPSHSPYEGA
ncbi:DUF300 domain protein, putative [Talaromyces stipitatus ATCC 10500]|uniref:DUF300 domain protein, putative n=1 Tax=Talaromyces stipitatus (strain ATCC 10500 / CBS 375.48 / QM 6759 / NRRL 1006) TaxID=441959 RepID=B8MR94_TALSN|nr:DUF300 domain protein, putative [Talaromyces stipitatus ATCC 10500]EED12989.1 DUF300 domain protein, putative [Talaromyces stipitatus ATCC 10500]